MNSLAGVCGYPRKLGCGQRPDQSGSLSYAMQLPSPATSQAPALAHARPVRHHSAHALHS